MNFTELFEKTWEREIANWNCSYAAEIAYFIIIRKEGVKRKKKRFLENTESDKESRKNQLNIQNYIREKKLAAKFVKKVCYLSDRVVFFVVCKTVGFERI